MNNLYILQGPNFTKPVRCHDFILWAAWMENRCMSRRVAQDAVGEVVVSTVFIGIDAKSGYGAPELWETLVRGGGVNETHRYSTLGDAKQGHAAVVARITKEMDK
jgi:hypothetical protein